MSRVGLGALQFELDPAGTQGPGRDPRVQGLSPSPTRAARPRAVPRATNSDGDNHSTAGQEVAGHQRAPVPTAPLQPPALLSPTDLSLGRGSAGTARARSRIRRQGGPSGPLIAERGLGASAVPGAVPWLSWAVGSGCSGVSRCLWGWGSAPSPGAERGLLGCSGGLPARGGGEGLLAGDPNSQPLFPQPCGTSLEPRSITCRCRWGRWCTSCRLPRVRVTPARVPAPSVVPAAGPGPPQPG